MHKFLVESIPKVSYTEGERSFCADGAIEGTDIYARRWREKRCKTDPLLRVTIYSGYMRKYWDLYIDLDNQAVFKRSWVVM